MCEWDTTREGGSSVGSPGSIWDPHQHVILRRSVSPNLSFLSCKRRVARLPPWKSWLSRKRICGIKCWPLGQGYQLGAWKQVLEVARAGPPAGTEEGKEREDVRVDT